MRALRACGACERSRERHEERGAAQRSPRKAVTGAWQLADRSFQHLRAPPFLDERSPKWAMNVKGRPNWN